MNDRSGQDVGTIVSHNIPKIRVDPTVEEWEIGRRRWQDWGGFSETFKQLDFQTVTDIPSGQKEGNALQNPVLERVLLRTEEVGVCASLKRVHLRTRKICFTALVLVVELEEVVGLVVEVAVG